MLVKLQQMIIIFICGDAAYNNNKGAAFIVEKDDIRSNLIINETTGNGNLLVTGKVGIGTELPSYPLQVHNSVSKTFGRDYIVYGKSTTQTVYVVPSSGEYTTDIAIYAPNGGLWSTRVVASSDKRIKKNIVEVNDSAALQKVRDISCCWYNYIDHLQRDSRKTIGFIAQQVKEHIPEAVENMRDFIPNVMKTINTTWENNKMYSNELLDINGTKYKFYVSNDLSGNDECEKIVVAINNDGTFTFDQSYNNVFCYGKEVDDFHTLDKQKLFALNFSATQEIDRIQQQQLLDISGNKVEVELLKIENAELKTEVNLLKSQLADINARLAALENA